MVQNCTKYTGDHAAAAAHSRPHALQTVFALVVFVQRGFAVVFAVARIRIGVGRIGEGAIGALKVGLYIRHLFPVAALPSCRDTLPHCKQ